MGEWKESLLGEILNLKRGYDLPNQDRLPGKIPIISSSGIMHFHSESKVCGPGVVTGRYGTIGEVFYTEGDYWPLNTTLYVQDFKGNHPKYIYYLLKGFDFGKYSDKSVVPGVNRNDLHTESVTVPDVPEQKAIAEVLSSLDDKINLLHRQNKTLESLAQTLFRQWFIEEADVRWEDGVVTDLIELNPKRILAKGTVAPYLEMSNLSNSLYHPADWYGRVFSSGTRFMNGDTLLARITPCLENGKTGFVDFLEDGQVGWGSTEFIVMRAKEPLHPFFSYILARHQDFRDFAIGCMVGSSGRQRADVDNLATYELKIPPTNVINRFNDYIEPSILKMKLNNQQIRDLVRLRDSLLPKLMNNDASVRYQERYD